MSTAMIFKTGDVWRHRHRDLTLRITALDHGLVFLTSSSKVLPSCVVSQEWLNRFIGRGHFRRVDTSS
jgi:hypothetical protein